MIDASEIREIKQGPYCGEADKVRFQPVIAEKVIIK
jgi:hypothetical protein